MANITAKKAGEMLKEGWVLLDVRPQEEIVKVGAESHTCCAGRTVLQRAGC